MSQLHRATSASSGALDSSIKFTWNEFVQIVLELTIQAYQAMYREGVAQHDWEENVFSLRLGYDYIREIAFDGNFPIRVSVRSKTHPELMRSGKQPTIEAKEIDIMLYDIWEREYHQKHFVWEAKRIGDKLINRRYQNLNSEYVHEAIYRFIRCEYAENLDDAGVLGYVLAGDVKNIVNDINESMGRIRKNPSLSPANHLLVAPPVCSFDSIYKSRHDRIDSTSIQLHHLFLSFDFGSYKKDVQSVLN